MPTLDWTTALLVATSVHLGFQLSVTMLVYPALAAVPVERWPRQHDLHSRRIVPLVAGVYLAVAVSVAGRLLSGVDAAAVTAAGAFAAVFVLTAGFAAPAHVRLSPGPEPTLLVRLIRIDRLRSLGATVAVVAAALA